MQISLNRNLNALGHSLKSWPAYHLSPVEIEQIRGVFDQPIFEQLILKKLLVAWNIACNQCFTQVKKAEALYGANFVVSPVGIFEDAGDVRDESSEVQRPPLLFGSPNMSTDTFVDQVLSLARQVQGPLMEIGGESSPLLRMPNVIHVSQCELSDFYARSAVSRLGRSSGAQFFTLDLAIPHDDFPIAEGSLGLIVARNLCEFDEMNTRSFSATLIDCWPRTVKWYLFPILVWTRAYTKKVRFGEYSRLCLGRRKVFRIAREVGFDIQLIGAAHMKGSVLTKSLRVAEEPSEPALSSPGNGKFRRRYAAKSGSRTVVYRICG